jgi:hypothetical protein
MQTDIKTVRPAGSFTLEVELNDGRKGLFDVTPYLHLPALKALRDADYFDQVSVLYGAVTWPDGEDIAPATLAAGLRLAQTA